MKDPGPPPPPPPSAHNKTCLRREVGFLHLAHEHMDATLLHASCKAEQLQSGVDPIQVWLKQTTL